MYSLDRMKLVIADNTSRLFLASKLFSSDLLLMSGFLIRVKFHGAVIDLIDLVHRCDW